MKVLAHRGYWTAKNEQNQIAALKRAADGGYGVEVDLRDLEGELVISHDPPMKEALGFDEFYQIFKNTGLPLALNIKSDGLASKLKSKKIDSYVDYFAFDMSIPQHKQFVDTGLNIFTPISEITPSPLNIPAGGIWLDAFYSDWYDASVIRRLLAEFKKVALVSPELHQRDHSAVWAMLKRSELSLSEGLYICTDMPEEADRYFNRNSHDGY